MNFLLLVLVLLYVVVMFKIMIPLLWLIIRGNFSLIKNTRKHHKGQK